MIVPGGSGGFGGGSAANCSSSNSRVPAGRTDPKAVPGHRLLKKPLCPLLSCRCPMEAVTDCQTST